MMDLVGNWLTGVTAAAILCALANSLMPDGPVRRVGRLACGLAVLAAVLGPVCMLVVPDFPAGDPVTAVAVGIVSGLAATGADQLAKQLKKTQ